MSLALASVVFSYARVQDGPAIRDELVFAGERLLLGATLFLVASIVKHASHDIPLYGEAMVRLLPKMGMSIMITVASYRVKRRPGHNDYFESVEATNKRSWNGSGDTALVV